jgi:predicted nucleic acid-binding protein
VLAYYLRKSLLTLADANHILERVGSLMQGCEYEVSSLYVLELAAKSTCSAYDCEFVALAEDLQVPLVTVDKQILEQFPMRAVSLDAVAGSETN